MTSYAEVIEARRKARIAPAGYRRQAARACQAIVSARLRHELLPARAFPQPDATAASASAWPVGQPSAGNGARLHDGKERMGGAGVGQFPKWETNV